ncbi:MAG: hypothetical protein KC800_03410 [Candidatus Eremiobacteraeota bacterium]|nr:hypothetical protein [Candidatus Eremiobacteraeota bacterium]
MNKVPRRDLAGWLLFSGLHLLNALFHCQWADELQAWSLVRESRNLSELQWLLSDDGHPALWYVLLWPLRFLTANPGAQQVVSSVCAIAVLALLWTRSPFRFHEKVLLSLSFQLGYALSVVSRSYVLGTLLIFLFAALWPRYQDRPWVGWVLLALLCNVHILYAPLSFCLALLWIDSRDERTDCLSGLSYYLLGVFWCSSVVLFDWGGLLRVKTYWFLALPTLAIAALLILALRSKLGPRGVLLLAWMALPPMSMMFNRFWGSTRARPEQAFSNFGVGLTPVVNPLQPDYWHLGIPQGLGLFLASVSCLVIVLYFRRRPFLLALIGLHAAFLLIVSSYLIPGRLWHAGVFFTGLLGVIWLARRQQASLGPDWLLLVLFIPQALVGSNAMIRSKTIPISSCYATAKWIRQQNLPAERLVGFSIFPTLGVATYLEEPIYFPEMNRRTASFDWTSGVNPPVGAKLIARRMRLLKLSPTYLVAPAGSEELLKFLDESGITTREIFRSPPALRGRYEVWELQLSDTSPP